MLSLEQLNALRGTKASATAPTATPVGTSDVGQNISQPADVSSASSGAQAQSQPQPQPQQESSYVAPVEVPCKNYDDEEGHFAYIDATTHQPMHVNLISGHPYTQDDVNRLSLFKVTSNLPGNAKNLTWQQVINNNTLYDQFGSPVFTVEEVNRVLEKMTTSENMVSENPPKTDPFGFPL